MQRLRDEAEKAKIELSTATEVNINLPFLTADADGPKHFEHKLTRANLEKLVGDLIDKTAEPSEKALKDAVLKLIHTNGTIERPEEWHAYHLALESIEFWHGVKDRFHKRLRYDLLNGTWRHQRLLP